MAIAGKKGVTDINPYNLNELPIADRAPAAKKIAYRKLREVAENENAEHISRMVARAELADRDEQNRTENLRLTNILLFLAYVAAFTGILSIFK